MSFDYSRSNPSGKKTAPLATSAAAGHKGALAATGEPENSYLGTLILYISIICTSSLLILNVISTSVGLILAWALHQDEIDRRVELDAEREKEHAISSVALVTSEPGDSRSYHSHIVVERDATPANYRIQEDIERSNGLKPQASSLKPQASSLKPQDWMLASSSPDPLLST